MLLQTFSIYAVRTLLPNRSQMTHKLMHLYDAMQSSLMTVHIDVDQALIQCTSNNSNLPYTRQSVFPVGSF